MRNLSAFIFILPICVLCSFASRPEMYFGKNLIPFQITAENGAKSYSDVEIKTITQEGKTTHIFALDKRKDDQHKSTFIYRLNFWSDSLNWCEDALNYLHCDAVYSSNFIMKFDGDSLIFPYAMKVGDTLPYAWATETQLYSGTENVRKIEFKNRKVIGVDSIRQGSVWFKGFLIQNDVIRINIADYGPLGKIPNEIKTTMVMLFDPAHGVIRTVTKSATGESNRILLDSKY